MLEVKNLTFQVNENGIERSIVENISFNVEDGEMLVITGPNGGGKSTLAKVLMGIDQASAGQIHAITAAIICCFIFNFFIARKNFIKALISLCENKYLIIAKLFFIYFTL